MIAAHGQILSALHVCLHGTMRSDRTYAGQRQSMLRFQTLMARLYTDPQLDARGSAMRCSALTNAGSAVPVKDAMSGGKWHDTPPKWQRA